jgi:signal transduction histidine kinase
VFVLVVLLVWRRAQRRVRAAEQAERSALERRDRFLATAAAELEAPLAAGRVDEARQILSELARPQSGVAREVLAPVDVGELVREIVEAPPFSDEGPPVILRAGAVQVRADRGRLANGLKVLLWTLRREAERAAPMVITVSAPGGEHGLIEIEAEGTAGAVEALERLGGVMEGVAEPVGKPGLTLALRVGAEVARANGGRLSARALAGQGERYVLELPL